MNEQELKTRLEQCRKDKAAIEAEEKKLLTEIEQQKKVPVLSWGTFKDFNDRIIINLTPEMITAIERGGRQIVINSHGRVCNKRQRYDPLNSLYSHITPIFGNLNPEEA